MERRFAGERFAMGVVTGVLIGTMTGNVVSWIGVGVALGVAFAVSARRQKNLPGRDLCER